jgi:predicted flap endonuclease-1-like 5' DNA nuclease
MGLLSKLKSLFGVGDGDRSAGSGVDVTVERDPSAEAEQAGGETTTDESAGAAATEDHPADPSEADEKPHIEEAEAEPETEAEPESEAEPETDAGADATAEEDETLTVEGGQETEDADPAEEARVRAESGDGEPVLELKGIGAAYAERLEEAGVTSVAELADEDPEDLADRVDLSAKRVGRWVDRAKDRR